jgi:hypothetical protein
MTRDDIIRMARKAGFGEPFIGGLSGRSENDTLFYIGEYPCGEEVFMLVNLAWAAGARAEREECAKVCDNIDSEYENEDVLAGWCADAIRARGRS